MRKRLKRIICVVCTMLILLMIPANAVLAETSSTTEKKDIYDSSNLTVNAAMASCVDTEQVLYEKDGDKIFSPGIVTKLMALMVAYDIFQENKQLMSEMVTVTSAWLKNCYTAGDRSTPYIGLAEGNTVTLEYLFATSLVANANDSCAVLVRYCSDSFLSSEAEFLEKMNERAKEIGMTNSHFYSTTGYNGGASYTTARDVTKLAAAFYRYNDLVELSSKYSYQKIRNKNYLLCDKQVSGYLYVGAIGALAGQATNEGNYSIVTYFERDGLAYAFVVLGAPGEHIDADGTHWFDEGNAYSDIHKLIPWAVDSFKYVKLCESTQILDELRIGEDSDTDHVMVCPAESVERLIMNPDKNKLETIITYKEDRVFDSEFNGKTVKTITAPVTAGEILGTAKFVLNGEQLAEVDLVARDSIDTNSLLAGLNNIRDFLFGSEAMRKIIRVLIILVIIWVVLAIAVFVIRILLKKRKKKAEKNKYVNKM